MKTYAAYYNNENIRFNSSSGGVFSLLAQYAFSLSGTVYGVSMSDDCYYTEFTRVDNESDLCKLRGSKYLQARTGNTFKNIKKDLEEDKFVLFSGTGCQINGLKKYLHKDYSNLLCVDVVCHGVPSSKLWKKYILSCEEKYGKIENVNFRNKDYGWKNLQMKNNQIYISKDIDPFMRMFLRDYCLRPSCYECIAKNEKLSDLTIADFWGIEKIAPEMNDGKGTSLVITRTEKGQNIFNKISNQLKLKEVTYEDGVLKNPAEYRSAKRPEQRDTFFSDLDILNFEEMKIKYASDLPVSFKSKVIRIIKKILMCRRKINSKYGLLFTFKAK